MTPEQNKVIHRVISTFGKRNQKMQTIEELQELQSAVFENVHRGTDNLKNIIEEVADVEIMLCQLKEIYNIDQKEIENVKEYKLTRLNHTIEKYLNKNTRDNTVVIIDRQTSNGR